MQSIVKLKFAQQLSITRLRHRVHQHLLLKTLGESKVAKLLEETLAEEKEADKILTERAYNNINFEAE